MKTDKVQYMADYGFEVISSDRDHVSIRDTDIEVSLMNLMSLTFKVIPMSEILRIELKVLLLGILVIESGLRLLRLLGVEATMIFWVRGSRVDNRE